jgi:hypothetical protein
MTTVKRQLTGHINVALPATKAFELFTPGGERAWAHGWDPHFPAPVTGDSRPGTVFETHAQVHGRATIWVVTERDQGVSIACAHVTPGKRAGPVTVVLQQVADNETDAEVTYDLTPLAPSAQAELDELAAGYDAYLHSWHEAINASVAGRSAK